MAPIRVHVVGDSFVDIVAGTIDQMPKFGGDATVERITQYPGGSALNVAVGMGEIFGTGGAADAQCIFQSTVGKDAFGEFLRARLALCPGLQDAVTVHPEWPTGVCIVLSGAHDRAFVTQEGAVGQQTLSELPVLAGLPGAALEGRTHIHLAGYFNCTALKPELPGLLKLIRDKHPAVTISLDTNYDSTETWNVDALLPYIDIFMPNEDEAMLISRTSSINEAGLALAERVKVAVIITCGKAGTKIFRRDPAGSVRVSQVAAIPGVKVVDTTGAGDAFAGGFLAAYVGGFGRDLSLEDACKYGSVTGALAVTKVGANTDPPSAQRVQECVEKWSLS